nr:hypothetical protein [Desulfitobacterium hafniense]
NDGNTNDNTPRTFVMSDLSPFPKKDELVISDKEVSKPFSVYLYIVTNGEAYKQHSAYSINITLVDETNGTITPIRTSLTIEEDIGYVVIDNIKYDLPARVHFHIEGIITKNKKDLFVSVDSNSFNIVGGQDPGGGQVPSDNNLIWEQEEVI